MSLGEKIQEVHGKVTGTRVLPGHHGVKVEVSYAGAGTILGVATTDIGTYVSTMTEQGVLHGEGQGMVVSATGDALHWHGHGVGKPTGKGMGASYRYSLLCHTDSTKWARLNGVLLVGEWEIDADGNAHGVGWEWK